MEDQRVFNADGPVLADCIVLFLDLLGTAGRRTDEEAQDQLRRTKRAIDSANAMSGEQDVFGLWGMLWFSDNVSSHLAIGEIQDESDALGQMVMEVAFFQLGFLEFDFIARGAIARGPHYSDGESFVHGPALERAVLLEKTRAKYPRVVLDEASIAIARRSLITDEGGSTASDWRTTLLVDTEDGSVFIDYLGHLTMLSERDGLDRLIHHRELVTKRLQESDGVPNVEEKYRWLAAYHNYFVESAAGVLSDGRVRESLRVPCSRPIGRFEPFGYDISSGDGETHGEPS